MFPIRNRIANTENHDLEPEKKEEITANTNQIKKVTPKKTIRERYQSLKKYLNLNRKPIKIFTVCSVIFVTFLSFLSNMQVGYAVIYNDETIGYVTERDTTKYKLEEVYKDLAECTAGAEIVEATPVFNPTFVPASKFTDENQIVSIIKDSLGLYVEACMISIDGQPQFALKSQQEAQNVLDEFKNINTGDGEIQSVEFKNTVTMNVEQVPFAKVLSYEDALSTLFGTNTQEGMYTVQKGDTIWSIAIENDMDIDYLMELNDLTEETIVPGQVFRVKTPEALIDVVVKKKISYIEYQPNETQYDYDANMLKDEQQVIEEGHNGETQVEAIVTMENRHETDREILSRQVLSEPVNKVIKVGTKPKPTNAPTGKFARPVSGGIISSPFGSRSRGNHTGIDYAVPYGSPVYASDGGTVTSAGWGGGYGYMVKINHGNGYETLYAHNSKLAVKVGQKVAKGDIIAYVGSTGNSTGPHCHFEIRKNGSYLNPANFV